MTENTNPKHAAPKTTFKENCKLFGMAAGNAVAFLLNTAIEAAEVTSTMPVQKIYLISSETLAYRATQQGYHLERVLKDFGFAYESNWAGTQIKVHPSIRMTMETTGDHNLQVVVTAPRNELHRVESVLHAVAGRISGTMAEAA